MQTMSIPFDWTELSLNVTPGCAYDISVTTMAFEFSLSWSFPAVVAANSSKFYQTDHSCFKRGRILKANFSWTRNRSTWVWVVQ